MGLTKGSGACNRSCKWIINTIKRKIALFDKISYNMHRRVVRFWARVSQALTKMVGT